METKTDTNDWNALIHRANNYTAHAARVEDGEVIAVSCNHPRLRAKSIVIPDHGGGHDWEQCYTCPPAFRKIPGVEMDWMSVTIVDREAYRNSARDAGLSFQWAVSPDRGEASD